MEELNCRSAGLRAELDGNGSMRGADDGTLTRRWRVHGSERRTLGGMSEAAVGGDVRPYVWFIGPRCRAASRDPAVGTLELICCPLHRLYDGAATGAKGSKLQCDFWRRTYIRFRRRGKNKPGMSMRFSGVSKRVRQYRITPAAARNPRAPVCLLCNDRAMLLDLNLNVRWRGCKMTAWLVAYRCVWRLANRQIRAEPTAE